ncbi:PREDICTED: uncharacterized protein LOC102006209 [Chinchilla lanigera]|uniref:uncharacterized protein LOC102006209 n=1 Tax=Chinchilla lanigera TaxID=34839 RepID=UPI00038E9877|nr:PREDICTED: uncharacterized protein LOC102006209 [Chinchilla lanigera]
MRFGGGRGAPAPSALLPWTSLQAAPCPLLSRPSRTRVWGSQSSADPSHSSHDGRAGDPRGFRRGQKAFAGVSGGRGGGTAQSRQRKVAPLRVAARAGRPKRTPAPPAPHADLLRTPRTPPKDARAPGPSASKFPPCPPPGLRGPGPSGQGREEKLCGEVDPRRGCGLTERGCSGREVPVPQASSCGVRGAGHGSQRRPVPGRGVPAPPRPQLRAKCLCRKTC